MTIIPIFLMSWKRTSCPTLFSAAQPRNMTGNRGSSVSSFHGRPPPKVTKLLSHLGRCWAKPAGAAPKGVIAPILRNGFGRSQIPLPAMLPIKSAICLYFKLTSKQRLNCNLCFGCLCHVRDRQYNVLHSHGHNYPLMF